MKSAEPHLLTRGARQPVHSCNLTFPRTQTCLFTADGVSGPFISVSGHTCLDVPLPCLDVTCWTLSRGNQRTGPLRGLRPRLRLGLKDEFIRAGRLQMSKELTSSQREQFSHCEALRQGKPFILCRLTSKRTRSPKSASVEASGDSVELRRTIRADSDASSSAHVPSSGCRCCPHAGSPQVRKPPHRRVRKCHRWDPSFLAPSLGPRFLSPKSTQSPLHPKLPAPLLPLPFSA